MSLTSKHKDRTQWRDCRRTIPIRNTFTQNHNEKKGVRKQQLALAANRCDPSSTRHEWHNNTHNTSRTFALFGSKWCGSHHHEKGGKKKLAKHDDDSKKLMAMTAEYYYNGGAKDSNKGLFCVCDRRRRWWIMHGMVNSSVGLRLSSCLVIAFCLFHGLQTCEWSPRGNKQYFSTLGICGNEHWIHMYAKTYCVP